MRGAEQFFVFDWIGLGWSSLRRLLGVLKAHRGLLLFSLALLAIDLFWTFYFGVARTLYELDRDGTLYSHERLLITTDGGVPEWFNYLKTLLVVVLLVRLARSTREPVYVSLSVTFLVVLLDDALQIHETAGRHIADWLEIPRLFGLRSQDVGEVITWSIIGAIVVPLLLYGLFRSGRLDRGNGLAILLPFGALLFCAIGVDQLYSNFAHSFLLAGTLLDMVEDGGEMLAISGACALVLAAGCPSSAEPP